MKSFQEVWQFIDVLVVHYRISLVYTQMVFWIGFLRMIQTSLQVLKIPPGIRCQICGGMYLRRSLGVCWPGVRRHVISDQ